jgi:hypothetical protein
MVSPATAAQNNMEQLKPVLHLLLILQSLACLQWIRVRKDYFKTPLYYFGWYLLFLVIAEICGWYLNHIGDFASGAILFKFLVIPIEYCFFLGLFFKLWKSSSWRWVSPLMILCYLIAFFIESYSGLMQGLKFFSLSYTLGNLFLLVTVLLFLLRLGLTDDILFLKNNPVFWICIGLMIFYIGSFPFYGLYMYIGTTNLGLFYQYQYIVSILNCIMYFLFILAGLWGKPKFIYSSFSPR